jgi:hypothetical protein
LLILRVGHFHVEDYVGKRLMTLTPSFKGYQHAHSKHREAAHAMHHAEIKGRMAAAGISHYAHRYMNGCSMLPLARSLLAATALAFEADYIFWADDDIFWRAEDVISAVQSGLPIVGFPCFHKPEDDGQVHFRLNYDPLDGDEYVEKEKDWRQVLMVGTGAMLVKAEVFHALKRTRPHFQNPEYAKAFPNINAGPHLHDYFPTGVRDLHGIPVFCGEDVSFCLEADKVGYPVMLHGNSVTIHCRGDLGAICDYAAIRRDVRLVDSNTLVSPGSGLVGV